MHSERLRKNGDLGEPAARVNVGSGRSVTTDGYVRLYRPDHVLADRQGWVLEHRMVMFDLGFLSDLTDDVHHRDRNKLNNAPANLQVLTPQAHAQLHNRRTLDYEAIALAYSEGATTIEVAERFGTFPGNVSRIIRRMGIPARSVKP